MGRSRKRELTQEPEGPKSTMAGTVPGGSFSIRIPMENPGVNTTSRSDAATELRYALDVMDEYAHLGLDDEYAGKLRDILLKRIGEAEANVSAEPASRERFRVPAGLQE